LSLQDLYDRDLSVISSQTSAGEEVSEKENNFITIRNGHESRIILY
jgi:hypothetical protein